MKILFLNPTSENTILEYPDEKGEGFIETEDYGRFPPLGLLYVLSYLEKHTIGHEIFFHDCVAEKISYPELMKIVSSIKPDIVGITSFTVSLVDVQKTARTVRQVVPKAHLCLGGHHPIAFPFEAAELEEFDSIVVGEGETIFTELVNAIEKGRDFTKIAGLYTRESIKRWAARKHDDIRFLHKTDVPCGYIKDLDSLPVPNRTYIKHIKYQSTVGKTDKLATVITSRGCPYRCTFCNVPFKEYRTRLVKNVIDEVEGCLSMEYREFHFYDDLFNITPEKVIEFCDEIEKRNLKFIWDFRGRVNTVTRPSLERAKRAGCRLISFGVETGSDEGLMQLRKATTVARIKEVFDWCRELGIKTIADFMIGLPFEKSSHDIMKNIDFLIELDPDYAQISILSLYPNTEVYDQALAKGLVKKGKWEEFALHPTRNFSLDYWTEYLSVGELIKLQKKAYKRYYLRPSYLVKSALKTESLYEFVTKVKGFLTLIS